MASSGFSCSCGKVSGSLANVPQKGIHLACFCKYCRAGALYCAPDLAPEEPVDLYLTQPENVTITQGLDLLEPFAFSPKGIIRWKTGCCGAQMFSSQPSPKTAFMSVRTNRLSDPAATGPVVCRAFVPQEGGKTRHEGKMALLGLIIASIGARLSGRWRKTALYDPATEKPIKPVTLVPQDEKAALLAS